MSDRGEPKSQHGPDGDAQHTRAASGGGHGGSHGRHGGGDHGGGGHEEHEGAPEWLISFADNVMLQMGFFVILFSLASLKQGSGGPSHGAEGAQAAGEVGRPTAAELDWAIAVREAFNNPVSVNSTDPRDALLVRRLRLRDHKGDSQARVDGLKGRERDVQSIRRADAYGTGGAISFDDGSAALADGGQQAVKDLARQFRGCRTVLELRGHCSAAEAYNQPDRGMKLSYDRARAVAELLVSEGLDWSQLRLTAYADSDRVTPVTYETAGQRSNQRVEVVELQQAAPRRPADAPAEPGAGTAPTSAPAAEPEPPAAAGAPPEQSLATESQPAPDDGD